MSTELIINCSLPETRIALLEDGEIQELLIEHETDRGIVGNIYKGKVTRVLPGMQAAFVDIGLEKAAFLYVDDVYVHEEVQEGNSEGASQGQTAVSFEGYDDYEYEEDLDYSETEETEARDDLAEETEGSSNASVEASSADESQELSGSSDPAGENDASSSSLTKKEGESEQLTDDDFDPRFSDDGKGDEPRVFSDDLVSQGASEDPSGDSSESSFSMSDESQEAGANQSEGQASQSEEDSNSSKNTGQHRKNTKGSRSSGGRGSNRNRRNQGGPRGRQNRRGGGGGPQRQMRKTNVPYPKGNYNDPINTLESDRNTLSIKEGEAPEPRQPQRKPYRGRRQEFKFKRDQHRRVHPKRAQRQRSTANIQDLLVEGQEVIVQVAKDPIAAKGARLTCHMSLAGRHLVCMPTIDHVGVSRRIEREDERRSLRDFVVKSRPGKMGFIVRTASGGKNPEHWIQQDMDYLSKLWKNISEKAKDAKSPAMIYEDLNPALRAVRDWVSEDIKRIVIDSEKDHAEIKDFVTQFMPEIKNRVEYYQGDIPIFDAYGLSTELHRSLERKVWLKSGGYIVVDQAEALVAIDVNTGRFVGKKNLEDTILKTNIEAVEEIAFQLRLRNCGGIIIIDLIDMEKEENRQRVYRALETAIKKDRARPTIVAVSKLGLIEMTRKRTRDTMVRALCESCSSCEGKGFIKSKKTVAYEVFREIEREGVARSVSKILVQAHPDVIDILAVGQHNVLSVLEQRYGKEIYLQAVYDFHQEQYEVSGEQDQKDRSNNRQRKNQKNPNGNRKKNHRGGRSHSKDQRQGASSQDPSSNRFNDTSGNSESQEGLSEPEGESQPRYDQRFGDFHSNSSLTVPQGEGASDSSQTAVDPIEEEDRLAYLRAQAAQDAAIASYNSPSSDPAMTHRSQSRRNNDRNSKPNGRGNNRGKGKRNAGSRNHRGNRGRNSNRSHPNKRNAHGNSGPSGGGGYRSKKSPSMDTHQEKDDYRTSQTSSSDSGSSDRSNPS